MNMLHVYTVLQCTSQYMHVQIPVSTCTLPKNVYVCDTLFVDTAK